MSDFGSDDEFDLLSLDCDWSTENSAPDEGYPSTSDSEVEQELLRAAVQREAPSGSLRLSSRGLRVVPDEGLALTSLIRLDLSDNALREVSPSIGGLRWLAYLDLSRNRLKDLPDARECWGRCAGTRLADFRLPAAIHVLAADPRIPPAPGFPLQWGS